VEWPGSVAHGVHVHAVHVARAGFGRTSEGRSVRNLAEAGGDGESPQITKCEGEGKDKIEP
jgi:hypothetical protein